MILMCCLEISYGNGWANVKKVNAIYLGPSIEKGKKRIRINLLKPVIVYSQGESFSDDSWVFYDAVAGDHAYAWFNTGDLFIDNMYAGVVNPKDDILFLRNRLWINGKVRLLKELSEDQTVERPNAVNLDIIDYFSMTDKPQEVLATPWKVSLRLPGCGGVGGETDQGILFVRGMTVIRINHELLYVHGINFGDVKFGDDIQISGGRVMINGVIRKSVRHINQDEAVDS